MFEAQCQMCGETFIPHSEDPEDLIHGQREDGTECGGQGVIQGQWVLHTLESHEREMPNCDDPDCEFHHPEVREF